LQVAIADAPELRAYQHDVIRRIWAAIEAAQRRVLLVAPTASGKTVIAGEIVRDAVGRGMRVLFLAHRRELIAQASRKLHSVGVDHGILLPGYPMRPGEPVQVASVATLHARAVRSCAIEMPPADVVVVDEAHHVRARTYQRILSAYPNAIIIGLTATPCRGDGRGLGNTFDILIESASVSELTALGFLVPTKIFAPTRPDLTGVRIERGDYVEKQLAERVDTAALVGDIISHWYRLAERRRTVVFATGVAHSVHLRDEFRRAGVLAEHIDGGTPIEERDAILAKLAAGTVEIVCNAMVLTEGWDCPEVSCIILARPTKSLGLYRQMVGRVLRPASGKTDALILDHAGAVFGHGFPDDPISWTLHEDGRAENRAHAARGTYNAPALTTCPECTAVRFQGKPCVVCGWRPRQKPKPVVVADGDLGQVARNRTVAAPAFDQRRFYAMLLHIAAERGYQRGWAAHKFKEKFGGWPSWRYVDPLPPDDATRAWVRSRAIAYAKAMQKQGAAR
jgi:DNA repair protein RadD